MLLKSLLPLLLSFPVHQNSTSQGQYLVCAKMRSIYCAEARTLHNLGCTALSPDECGTIVTTSGNETCEHIFVDMVIRNLEYGSNGCAAATGGELSIAACEARGLFDVENPLGHFVCGGPLDILWPNLNP